MRTSSSLSALDIGQAFLTVYPKLVAGNFQANWTGRIVKNSWFGVATMSSSICCMIAAPSSG